MCLSLASHAAGTSALRNQTLLPNSANFVGVYRQCVGSCVVKNCHYVFLVSLFLVHHVVSSKLTVLVVCVLSFFLCTHNLMIFFFSCKQFSSFRELLHLSPDSALPDAKMSTKNHFVLLLISLIFWYRIQQTPYFSNYLIS